LESVPISSDYHSSNPLSYWSLEILPKFTHSLSAEYNDIMLDIRQATLPHDPLERYNSMVASGDLRFDAQQQQVAARLSELAAKLAQHQMEMDKFQVSASMQLVVFPVAG
jgi:predicted ATPase